MELALNLDQQLFHETTQKFLDTEAASAVVRALQEEPDGFRREYWRAACELGWTAMLVPEAHGGGSITDRPLADLAVVAEEIGRHVAPGPFLACNLAAVAVTECGSTEQQEALLPGLVGGDTIATWCPAEALPNARGDRAPVTATPVDGDFVLDGVAPFVEAAQQADWLVVSARTGDTITQFVVPRETPGLLVRPLECLDLVRRLGDVELQGVRLPASSVLGSVGAGAEAVERQLQVAAALQCAETAGAVGRVFDFTLEYVSARYSFGRPLASYQAIKHRFADMRLWVECCFATSAAAIDAVQDRVSDAGELVSVAASYVGDRSTAVIQECVQMHGGMGVTWEHDIHLFLRRATVNRSLYGTPREHRARIATSLGM